jgi:ABC-type transporter Mla MlaB component
LICTLLQWLAYAWGNVTCRNAINCSDGGSVTMEHRSEGLSRTGDAPEGTLQLEGNCTVSGISEIYSQIREALAANAALTVDVGKLDNIDVALLQLLIAAKKAADEQRKSLTVKGGSEAFQAGLVRAGLLRDDTTTHTAQGAFLIGADFKEGKAA